MENGEIRSAFDLLLEEIDEIVLRLNEKGALLFSTGKYEEARALLAKVESIISFRGKVLCLEDDWKTLNVPKTKKSSESGKKRKTKRSIKPLKKGLKTSYDDFRFPILVALSRLGGTANIQEVLCIVEEIMSDQLNKYDYQPLPSNTNSVRWKNTAQWERYNMVQDGLLASDSPHGVWEITVEGKEILGKAKENTDIQKKLFSGN